MDMKHAIIAALLLCGCEEQVKDYRATVSQREAQWCHEFTHETQGKICYILLCGNAAPTTLFCDPTKQATGSAP